MRFDGAKLKDLRVARKFDQQRLASAIGANQSQISRYEHGKSQPSGRVAIAIAKTLGVAVTDFYSLEEDEEEAAASMPMTREEQEVIVNLFARLAGKAVKA